MILIPLSTEKFVSPADSVPLLSHLTYCTPTKSNLHIHISFATVMSEPVIHWLLSFHLPNLVSTFRSLGYLSKESIQVQGFL
jgi:hypothetical protein